MANEKRLIVDALKKYHDAQFTPGVYEHSIFGKAAMLLEVDAVEVVHGRWVDRYSGKYANHVYDCSECKKPARYKCEGDVLGNAKWMQDLTNYCPNCGAKMDGGADNG